MSDYYQFVSQRTQMLWSRQLKEIVSPAIERYATAPATFDDFSFSILYSAVLTWGPGSISELIPQLAPLVHVAISTRDAKPTKTIADLGVANFANLLGCCGAPDEIAPITEWLSEIETSRNDESTALHWDRAFAALAVGRTRLYRALSGADPDEPLPHSRDQVFGGNIQGFFRHLAAAVEQRSGFDAVEPAWRDFVRMLSAHEDARSIDRTTPFWVARIVHHQIGGAALGDVAEWLHREIMR